MDLYNEIADASKVLNLYNYGLTVGERNTSSVF